MTGRRHFMQAIMLTGRDLENFLLKTNQQVQCCYKWETEKRPKMGDWFVWLAVQRATISSNKALRWEPPMQQSKKIVQIQHPSHTYIVKRKSILNSSQVWPITQT